MAKKQKPAELIPAVGYLQKSTKGTRKDGRERQEKSLSQQRMEVVKLAKGRFKFLKCFEDEGVPGWKRGADRPDFQQMLSEVKSLGAQAVLYDDIDRFFRAEVMDVFSDLSTLVIAGVKTIHCVNQCEYTLGDNDIGRIIKMVVDVHDVNATIVRRPDVSPSPDATLLRREDEPVVLLPTGWPMIGRVESNMENKKRSR